MKKKILKKNFHKFFYQTNGLRIKGKKKLFEINLPSD
jgi:hypothetical protein